MLICGYFGELQCFCDMVKNKEAFIFQVSVYYKWDIHGVPYWCKHCILGNHVLAVNFKIL